MSSRPSAERRARLLPLSPALLLLLLPEIGCFVSFDGYGPLETNPDAAVGGATSTGGATASGGAAASGGAGTSSGGAGGRGSGGSSGGSVATGGAPSSGGLSPAGGTVSTGGTASTGGTGGAQASGGTSSGGTSAGGASTGGVPATGGSGTGGAGTGGAPVNCPTSLAGPEMIEIPKPGGGSFCIDKTEVTNENYAVFLAVNQGDPGQTGACNWNTTFAPTATGNDDCRVSQYEPATKPKTPVSCIDWCDAKRYCEWAGKRLCGAMNSGALAVADFADAAKSQWYAACSAGGTRPFPYGAVHNPNACADLDNAATGTHAEDVMRFPACVGGYPRLFDMSGNVAEWEDSCGAAAGAGDACLIRGGGLFDNSEDPPTTLCNSSAAGDTTPSPATARRDKRSEFIGVRCCYDL